MILKKLKRRVFRKPKATMIRELIAYILQPQDERGQDKLAYHGAKNFITGTLKGQREEMVHLAAESVRSPMPVTHWCLSWQENEQPSNEQIDEAVDIFLERMGLSGHQVIYAAHKNTGHCHVHIAVNRTNPDTLKTVQPHRGFDIEAAHRIVAELVHRQGWTPEAKARYHVNKDGKIVRNFVDLFTSSVKTSSVAADFESNTGEKSAERIAQEQGHRAINRANSWAELHRNMQEVGLRFEKKGSGAVVFVGEVAVKASSIDRHFGLSKLCKRLGEYEPGDYAPEMKAPEPEPVSPIVLDEWREYQALKKQEAEERQEEKARRIAIIAKARTAQRAQRRTVLSALSRHGVPMLNIGRHFLKKQQQEELQRLKEEQPKPRKPLPRFITWLTERNRRARLLWRYRRRIKRGMEKQLAKPFEFQKIGNLASPYQAYRELLLQQYTDKIDPSQLDAVIAMRMRLAGYTPQETANEMHREARPLRMETEHRDWRNYYSRTVWYAFDVAGDIDIATEKPTPEQIMAFHQAAERIEAARTAVAEEMWEAPRQRMR